MRLLNTDYNFSIFIRVNLFEQRTHFLLENFTLISCNETIRLILGEFFSQYTISLTDQITLLTYLSMSRERIINVNHNDPNTEH
jgi:hypothetical protein